MISRGRKRRGYWQRRRRKQSMLPAIVAAVLVVLLLGWGVAKAWNALGQGKAQQTSALMQLIQGSTDFALIDSDQWVTSTSDAALISGEQIRTQNNSEASLTFLERSNLFLSENTQMTIDRFTTTDSGKNTVELTLHKGEIWGKIDDSDFNKESGSSFVINSARAVTNIEGTVLDITTTENQDTIRLIKGKANVDVYLDDEKKDSTNVEIGVGQKVIINEASLVELGNGSDIIESIDQSFQESNWHLSHLEQFFPNEAAQITERIQQGQPATNVPTSEEEGATQNVDPSIEAPQILIPANNSVIPASAVDMIIEGTAPAEAEFITVNGYTLTKYIPGDRKWSYFAAKKFGTLNPGENNYQVVATTRDGRASEVTTLTVNYEGTAIPEAPVVPEPATTTTTPTTEVSSESTENSIGDFPKPIVTRPATGSFGDPFQTSSKVITITGTVDPTTQSVSVNGFELRQFAPGDTEFSYIANATYGNLREGLNEFKILAFGPDNKISETAVSIIYTPIEIR